MPLQAYTMAEILAWEDLVVKSVCEDVLFPGQLSLLVGAPKIGKTTLARTLALAVCRGVEWMGRPCEKGSVYIVQTEGHPHYEKRAFKQLGATKDDETRMHVGPDTGDSQDEFLDQLETWIEKLRPTLVVIDTLFRALHLTDINDYAAAVPAMSRIVGVARRTEAHIMLIHHGRKSRGGSDNDLSLGSQALTGTSDTNIYLKGKKAGSTKLTSEQRYGRPFEEIDVHMDKETGWCHALESDSKRDERVIELLKKHPTRWMTYTAIRRALKLSGDAMTMVVGQLVRTHRVKKTGTGKPGDPRKLKLT